MIREEQRHAQEWIEMAEAKMPGCEDIVGGINDLQAERDQALTDLSTCREALRELVEGWEDDIGPRRFDERIAKARALLPQEEDH